MSNVGIKSNITGRNRVFYHVKWLGLPEKKDWTFEPYEEEAGSYS